MRRTSRGAGLVVLGLAVVVAAGCASEKNMAKSGSGDIVADRQRLMKLHGQLWSDIQAKAKANQYYAGDSPCTIVVNLDSLQRGGDDGGRAEPLADQCGGRRQTALLGACGDGAQHRRGAAQVSEPLDPHGSQSSTSSAARTMLSTSMPWYR